MLKAKGNELIFISQIKRDGSGVIPIEDQGKMQQIWGEKEFQMASLSITQDTYIASEFNSYVVKLKNNP